MNLLQQSTAGQIVVLGPFLDSGDGNTEETALTIANTDIKIHKAGATALVNKNSGGATHMANGLYYITIDATDSNTLGGVVIYCHPAGALPVKWEGAVVTPAAYNVLTAVTGDAFARLGAPAGASVSADVAAVQADTNDIQSRLPAALVGGRMDSGVGAMDAGVMTEVADAMLDRNLAGGASGGSRNVRNALRSLRNRQGIAAGTLTVYQEDDTTPAWTAAVTTTAGNPLSEIDPV